MYESVVFVSRFNVQKLIPDAHAIVISLTIPNDPVRFEPGWRGVLQLEFHDVSEEFLGLDVGSLPDADNEGHLVAEFKGRIFRLPDVHHAKAIVNFLTEHQGGCSDFVSVIVHCDMGRSRSAAVAQFVADRYEVPIVNSEPEWLEHVTRIDTTLANPRLLRLLRKTG